MNAAPGFPSPSALPSARCLGIEIGGTKLQLVVGDAMGAIIDRRRSVIDPSQGASAILASIQTQMNELMTLHAIGSIGVGYGGPVDWRTGRIVRSYHIQGWDGFALGDWLTQRSGRPAMVENDANVAALAEGTRGAGQAFESMVYVTLGSGVGAGFITAGSIFHGAPPGELELGHVRLHEQGLTVQQRCSGWAVDALVREAVQSHPNSELAAEWRSLFNPAASLTTGGEARCLAGALERQCPLAKELLDGTMRELALALSHVVHLIHPHAIIIGGGLSLLGLPLLDALRHQLRGFIMDAFEPGPHLALAALGEDVVPVGALLLAGRGVTGDTPLLKANG